MSVKAISASHGLLFNALCQIRSTTSSGKSVLRGILSKVIRYGSEIGLAERAKTKAQD